MAEDETKDKQQERKRIKKERQIIRKNQEKAEAEVRLTLSPNVNVAQEPATKKVCPLENGKLQKKGRRAPKCKCGVPSCKWPITNRKEQEAKTKAKQNKNK